MKPGQIKSSRTRWLKWTILLPITVAVVGYHFLKRRLSTPAGPETAAQRKARIKQVKRQLRGLSPT